jgi:hypothetical protein
MAARGGHAEALHELRLACKRLRYFVGMFAELVDAPGSELVKPLKAMQDRLGQLHDLDEQIPRVVKVLRKLERRLLSGDLDPDTVRKSEAQRPIGTPPYQGLLAALTRPRPPERLGLQRVIEAMVAERRKLEAEVTASLDDLLAATRRGLESWLVAAVAAPPEIAPPEVVPVAPAPKRPPRPRRQPSRTTRRVAPPRRR